MTQGSDMLINMCTCELPHTYFETVEHSKIFPFTCRRDRPKHSSSITVKLFNTHAETHIHSIDAGEWCFMDHWLSQYREVYVAIGNYRVMTVML